MKKYTRFLALALIIAVALGLTGCAAKKEAPNTAPGITGAQDMTVEANNSIDVLAGLKATDAEDGDLTSMITVSSTPALTFANGKATPANAGDYELVYTVTDKGGLTAEAFATLTVTRQTGKAEVFKTFDFSIPAEADAHGWEARIGENDMV